MTALAQLNRIAVRIAIAIVLAIVLGLSMAIAVNNGLRYLGYREVPAAGNRSHFMVSGSAVVTIIPRQNPLMLAGKIALLTRTLAQAAPADRARMAAAVVEPGLQIDYDPSPLPGNSGQLDEHVDWLRRLIQVQLEDLVPAIELVGRRWPIRPGDASDVDTAHAARGDVAMIDALLPDGRRVAFTLTDYPVASDTRVLVLLSIGLVIVLVSLWTGHRLAKPIRQFARAAERLGVDLKAPPLAVRGPQELRTTIDAFNRMQDRLRRFLEDRTQMLAAISHDLRAPLARLRLRAELVSDGEQQRKMFDDLDAMNAMIDSTLAFARDDARQEPRTRVDLGVLVGDLCEDVADAGGEVCYRGERGIDVPCRPTLLCRAVANLIDNALKYGTAAGVTIVREADRVLIVVDDDGPGIAPDEQEKVFAPFYRLQPARDPTKAGVGLGLSIARTVAREHGGDVTLTNRDSGGLSAVIALPA